MRAFRRTPPSVRLIITLVILATVALTVNWIYQVYRKPTELFFPLSGALFKTPTETWREYGSIFRRNSTNILSPELLAALAQVEGSGNPIARTYWRWAWNLKPFELYRPASSSVGMYQMTDGTFAEARHYCIHHHVVVEDGPWDDWRSCWFTRFYFRVIPSHSVELTAAYLDVHVRSILARYYSTPATLQQKQNLATLIHLCGAGAADLYARHGFHLAEGQRCGDHDPRVYLARVDTLKREFARMAAEEE